MEKMYSINEICEELHVSRRTVHLWIQKRQLKVFHLGGKRLPRVWESDLDRFVRTGRSRSRKSRNQ
jgi:excisionase family DNA binding protein